jgi:hypothetical protein
MVTHGRAVRGRCARNRRGTPALYRVLLRDIGARAGSGLSHNGTTTLTEVIIRGNAARAGSGVFNTRNATFTWRQLQATDADKLDRPSSHKRTCHESDRSEV